ncbi:MAG: rane protein [Firmicutes bacterium]|nr:rane protein [Bacillota bacterium]
MRAFFVFTKKELVEQLRTYKSLILLSVFFLFGMMSPLLAKLLPEILSGMELQGMKIEIPEPTVLDAYGQFFKNLTQMGLLATLLVFGGILSNEMSKGTLINILAKGLPRYTVLLSKFTAAVLLWSASYGLAAGVNYGYTEYLFENTAVHNLGFSLFCLWLFGCFIIAVILLSSTILSGNFGGLILSAGAIVVMLILNIFPGLEKYNPITLASKNVALLLGTATSADLTWNVVITCLLTLGSLLLSAILFHRKRI